jgi:hypothetical protein
MIHGRRTIVKSRAWIAAWTRGGRLPAVATAVAVVAIALAGGGYDGVALGIGTIAVWIAVVVVALGPGRTRPLTRPYLAAAAALAVLPLLAALSLGWSIDRTTGFVDVVRSSGYLGAFLLVGLLLRPASRRPVMVGVGIGLVAVSLLALGSRLLGIGDGDAELVATMPSSAGRLSYPVGYWNALGSLAAMAVPVLVWIASSTRRQAPAAAALASIPPVVLTTYMTSSRGALIAAAIGTLIVIAASESRTRAVIAFATGTLAGVPAIVAVMLAPGILDGPGEPPGRPELIVCAALLAGMALVAAAGPRLVLRRGPSPIPRLRMRHLLAAALVLLVAVVFLVGPGEIAGDFAVTDGRQATASGNQLSIAGSGRAQFWETAVDAFAAEPLRGIGAGSFGLWWNRYGSLETSVQNAHSEPLELIAELGPVGLAAFLAFFGAIAVAGVRGARFRDGSAAGPALGLITTALVGVLIDWTWSVPAVTVPVLIAAAVVTTRARALVAEREQADPRSQPVPVPAPALAVGAAIFAAASIWAGGVLAIATDRLDASRDEMARGDLSAAAAAARSAAAVEPWSAEPWIRLATIENAAGNLVAARAAVERAVALTPEDFRSWILATSISSEITGRIFESYGRRALLLAPFVISHAELEPAARPGPGS